MRTVVKFFLHLTTLAVFFASVPAFADDAAPAPAAAVPGAPSDDACKANPQDPVTQGGCLVISQQKGNCVACHEVQGANLPGNVGPPLSSMKQRFPDKAKLRAQIWDPSVNNPRTAMPPFGKNHILTEDEIDKVVEFIYTL